jgi:hypothetical protein
MSRTSIGHETIDGVKFDIAVDSTGLFWATFDGNEISASTRKVVVDKLREAIRTAKHVAVPASLVKDPHWRRNRADKPVVTHIILTGIHGSNRNVLYREDRKGAKGGEQLSSYDGDCMRRLTDEEVATHLELWLAHQAAAKALEAWVEEHKIHPEQVVKDAAQVVLKQKGGDRG